jgi:catalase
VEVHAVVDRMMMRLAYVDVDLARRVSIGLGLPAPSLPSTDDDDGRPDASGVDASPALAMVTENTYPLDGRVVHILAADGADLPGIRAVRDALLAQGVTPHVVATHKGAIAGGGLRPDELTVDRSFHTASSAEADAIVVAAGTNLAENPAVITFIQSAYRHFKPVAAWGDGADLLAVANIGADEPGVVVGERPNSAFIQSVASALAVHRHWDRVTTHPTRTPVTKGG